MPKIAGIDLGTTYSAIAIINEYGKPVVIPNSEGKHITPSIIHFMNGTEPIIGEVARNLASGEPYNFIQLIKRDMGKESIMNGNVTPFTRYIDDEDKKYTPQTLSALILKKLKKDCEAKIGDTIESVVITVPAYFNDKQKRATEQAAKIAGLNVIRIINEPTAAALAYAIDRLIQNQTFLVYDLGGGTFDVSIASIKDKNVEIIASIGDPFLGGVDFDETLKNLVKIEFIRKFSKTDKMSEFEEKILKIDLTNDLSNFFEQYLVGFSFTDDDELDLLNQVEKLKIDLSTVKQRKALIRLGNLSLTMEITREKFEEITYPLLEKTSKKIDEVFSESQKQGRKITWDDIDNIILVGGSSRMNMVSEMLSKKSKKPLKIDIQPDLCVAEGAAIAAMLGDSGWSDISSHSLGTAIIKDFSQPTKLYNAEIIPKFTKLPAIQKKLFPVASSKSTSVSVKIYQGDNDLNIEDCCYIGKLALRDIPPRDSSEIFTITTEALKKEGLEDSIIGSLENLLNKIFDTKKAFKDELNKLNISNEQKEAIMKISQGSIEVTLEYDKNGIVKAFLKDLISGKETSGEIQNRGGLPDDEIEDMKDIF